MGFDIRGNKPGAAGSFLPNSSTAAPAGSYNVVGAGADPTGASDSTTAIANAIDYVIANQSLVKTVWFPAGGTFKMNSQIQRNSIPNGTVLNLVGGPGATIDATGSASDNAVFDLSGSQGISSLLATPIALDDAVLSPVSLALAVGDVVQVTTRTWVGSHAQQTSASFTNGSPNVTVGSAIFLNGDAVGGNSSATVPVLPPGTTVLSGGGTTSLVLTANANATDGAGKLFQQNMNVIWTPDDPNVYKGEFTEVETVTTPNTSFALKHNFLDSYDTTHTTVLKINSPTILIDGLIIKRNATKVGVVVSFCRDFSIRNCTFTGCRDTCISSTYNYGGVIENNSCTDFYSAGTGYGILLASTSNTTVANNHCYGGRHAITSGGNEPSRCNIYMGNVIDNAKISTQPGFDMHAGNELATITGNQFNGGVVVSCSNVLFSNNQVRACAPGVAAAHFIIRRNNDFVRVIGNSFWAPTASSGNEGIRILCMGAAQTLKNLEISNNVVRSADRGIRFIPNSSVSTGITINNVSMVDNDVEGGTGAALEWALSSTAAIKILDCKIIGGRYESTALDGAQITVDPASLRLRCKDVTFNMGSAGRWAVNGTTAQSFVDMIFDGCLFSMGAGGSNARGLNCFNTGRLQFLNCEWDRMSNNGGIAANSGGTTGTNAPTQINVVNPRYTGSTLGIIQAPAATAITEHRIGGIDHVAGDWAFAGWGASAALTIVGDDRRGVVTITTNAADTPTANPTLTLTVKERGFTRAPVANCNFDSSSTGPFQSVATTCAQTTAGSNTTNSVSKMTLTYRGTPTPTSALTYKFAYRLDG